MPARLARTARGWIDGSLGAQLVAILTCVGLLGSVAVTLLLAIVITPGFDRLEIEAAAAQRDRVAAMLAEIGERTAAAAGAARPGDAPGAYAVDMLVPLAGGDDARLRYRVGDGNLTIVARGARMMAVRRLDTAAVTRMTGLGIAVGRGAGPERAIARDGRRIALTLPLADSDGRIAGHLRLSMPRDLSALGQRMLLLAVGGSTLLLLIVLAVLRRSITALVLQPLGRLEAHMQAVRATGAPTPCAADPRSDEIGSVTRSFNAMLSQLADLRERVEAQSYRLGQSESAVAMIHNVRNALTPVSTILSQGLAQPPATDPALVARALAELAGEEAPAARRRKLAGFVAAAFEAEQTARAERLERFEIGRASMRQALSIIGRQQVDAHARSHLMPCDVAEITAQNAAIVRFAGALPVALTLPDAPAWAIANRVVLSQIVGNLLANAVEAIAAAGKSGRIDVAIDVHDGQLVLAIADDGEGFDPGRGAHLFQRGFSTRSEKAGGLGLHWCANAANAMGGTLTLESDGPGRGARARLSLRVAPADQAGTRAAA